MNHRKRALRPVVLQRQQLADALARLMTQLGLERKAKQLPSLSEYLSNNKTAPTPTGGTKPQETSDTPVSSVGNEATQP